MNGGSIPANISFLNLEDGQSLRAVVISLDGLTILNDTHSTVDYDYELVTINAQTANFSTLSSTFDAPLQKSLTVATRLSCEYCRWPASLSD